MKSGFFITLMIILFSSVSLSAITVDVDFGSDTSNATLAPLKPQIIAQVKDALGKYDNMPDFAKGFGNANTYVSHVATLRGYQEYSIFAVALGTMVSLQAPNEDPLFFIKIQDDLNDGDVYAGLGMTPLAVQGGVNLSFFIEDLYLSCTYGRFDYKIEQASYSISYDSSVYGLFLSYGIFKEKSILSRTLVWRGISVESGFIYSSSLVKFDKELDPIEGVTDGIFTATVDPSVTIEFDTKSYIIPVEIYTSIRFFYIFNLGVGGGVDFVSGGNTDINLLSDGGATITDDGVFAGSSGMINEKGKITVDASTKDVRADWYRLKFMTNIGLSAGPVFIDLPLTYYFTDNGYAVGVSAGIVW